MTPASPAADSKPRRPWYRRPTGVITAIIVAGSFGLWTYAFSGAARKDPPDTLRDPAYAAQAEALCAPTRAFVLGLPSSMAFVDEPYWPCIGDASKVRVLATSDEQIHRGDDRARNPGDGTVATVPVFWTYEAPDTRGRVFVSVFGHYMWTFDDPYFRLLLLRGMAWAARDNPYRFDALATDGVRLAE